MIADGLGTTLFLAMVFFVAIPGSGAFLVRRRWRRFRRALLEARGAPSVTYGLAHQGGGNGSFRFFGRLEAIQADHTIWVGDRTLSVMVRLDGVPVFVMPHAPTDRPEPPDETPRVLYWKDLSALAEGTQVFVCGSIVDDQGSIRIEGGPDGVPLVIIFDGPSEELFPQAMWAGRQRNEYWNHLTPISLIAGFVSETLWAVTVVGESRLQAVIALVVALVPVLPLFPPGVAAFYWYRRLWRHARRIRARRDLALVQQATPASRQRRGGNALSRAASRLELVAVALLAVGIGTNGYLLAALAALLLR